MAVASAEPYASLHLAPVRLPCQYPTTQFFTGRMPFLPPNQQRQSTEGNMIGASLQKIWKSHSTKVLPPNQQRQSTEGTQLFTQWRQNVRVINVIFNAEQQTAILFCRAKFHVDRCSCGVDHCKL